MRIAEAAPGILAPGEGQGRQKGGTGVAVFSEKGGDPWVFFEQARGNGKWLWQAQGHIASKVAEDGHQVAAVLRWMEAGLSAGHVMACAFSFELGHVLEPALRAWRRPAWRRSMPLIWAAAFCRLQPVRAEALKARVQGALAGARRPSLFLRPSMDAAAHAWRHEAVQEAIAAGEVYQVNLTFPMRGRWDGSDRLRALALYLRLRGAQPAAFGAFLGFGPSPAGLGRIRRHAGAPGLPLAVLSFSPERLLQRDGDKVVSTPMKGTIRRGRSPEEDRQLQSWLVRDEKNRAENLMITDMVRNDLGRICRIGSVHAPALFRVETLPTVHQMVSDVEGTLAGRVRLMPLLQALLPPASVTGAPKIGATRLISRLETASRDIYCGAIGWLRRGRAGRLQGRLNVAIRTLVLHADGRARYDVGSGIVSDSMAGREYAECLLKARFLQGRPA